MHIHQRAVDGDDKAQRGDWPEDKVRQPAHGIESALLFQLFTDIVQRLDGLIFVFKAEQLHRFTRKRIVRQDVAAAGIMAKSKMTG
ncbi:Uncharacterised protein [Klebsiella pneumoniae]|nr:Uncharacterised protein [Klebsiella pneumoniae]SWJ77137.1 Uncharacterised protein [Klebsiella pneumoniae]SWN62225.1 Uncharacterised protein [Klebsiella pneumoniae]SWW58936.1 Uncharacterised protein [Klebsiella pneumoniae]SYV47522.1 Uncharacterised protein [Klebsiella pneumoniae]